MLSISIVSAQSDTSSRFNRLLTRLTKDDHPPERPRFLAYPTFGYSPETSFEFGVASSLLFHAKNDYQHNRLSEVTAFGFFTLRSQYGLRNCRGCITAGPWAATMLSRSSAQNCGVITN